MAYVMVDEAEMAAKDVEVRGTLILDGLVEGNVVTSAEAIVRQSGRIVGDLESPRVEVAGEIQGSVRTEALLLHPGGRILGDILPWRQALAAGGRSPDRTSLSVKPRSHLALAEREAAQPPDPVPLRLATRALVEPPGIAPSSDPAPDGEPPLAGAALDVLAGPFARFSQLAEFLQAFTALPGVEKVDTRQFYQGTVQLRVRYANPIPLAARVAELKQFQPDVSTLPSGRIEMHLHLPAQPAASGEAQPARMA